MSKSSKMNRKTKRILEKVSQEWSISQVDQPTKCLLLCNVGLMNGYSYEDIFELFCPFGDLEDVCLLSQCSYSFVQFENSDSAKNAFGSLHGKCRLPKKDNSTPADQVLYLSYVDKCPPPSSDTNLSWTSPLPDGLKVVEDFLSEAEEKIVLENLDWSRSDEKLKHRKVLHYGYRFCYGSNSIDKDSVEEPFPSEWQHFLLRAMEKNLLPYMPDQCTVNRYEIGDGIPAHVDSHECCKDTLASLSLVSDVVMNFASLDDQSKSKSKLSVLLKAKSFLILSGEARYAYSHGITPKHSDIVPLRVKNDESKVRLTLQPRKLRISLTFRKTLDGPCKCSFPAFCSSQQSSTVSLDSGLAAALEKTHVHSVYETIAGHFSETRHKRWPRVEQFVQSFPAGSVLVDIGCGNGKYLGNSNLVEVGCDYSDGLLRICRERGFEVARSDCLAVPIRSSSADGCICIAVIHHLATKERRQQAISEMGRILRPGGRALIYAWAKEQERDSVASSYLKQQKDKTANEEPTDQTPTGFPLVLPVHKNRTNFEHSDLLVPWKTKAASGDKDPESKTFLRYYHVFVEGELEDLIVESMSKNNLEIEESYYDQGNWCVKLVKK